MNLPERVPLDEYQIIGEVVGWSPLLLRAMAFKETWRHEENPNDIRFEKHKWRRFRMASREAKRFDRARNSRDREKRWEQFERMDRICQRDAMLNRRAGHAAILSHSFGWMQIMGFNHRHCGFEKPREFLAAMKTLEGQRDCMIQFILENPTIQRAGAAQDLDSLGYHWNGPAYRRNHWARDIARFYVDLKIEGSLNAYV